MKCVQIILIAFVGTLAFLTFETNASIRDEFSSLEILKKVTNFFDRHCGNKETPKKLITSFFTSIGCILTTFDFNDLEANATEFESTQKIRQQACAKRTEYKECFDGVTTIAQTCFPDIDFNGLENFYLDFGCSEEILLLATRAMALSQQEQEMCAVSVLGWAEHANIFERADNLYGKRFTAAAEYLGKKRYCGDFNDMNSYIKANDGGKCGIVVELLEKLEPLFKTLCENLV